MGELGPGAYDDKFKQTKRGSTSWTFGSGREIEKQIMRSEQNATPGPGRYEFGSTLDKKGVTVKVRHPVNDKFNK